MICSELTFYQVNWLKCFRKLKELLKLSQHYNSFYIQLTEFVLVAFIIWTSNLHLFFFCGKGGCDEEISIFLYRGCVDKEIITQLQGKETGLREHGELIKVRVVPYKKLWRTTADCMVLVAVALLEMAMKEGLLPTLST